MAISSYKIDEIAAYAALSQVFNNIDEEGWPVDPMRFLDNCAETSLEYAVKIDGSPNAEMIPLAPYAEWTAVDLVTLVTEFKEAVVNAIEVALSIERKDTTK